MEKQFKLIILNLFLLPFLVACDVENSEEATNDVEISPRLIFDTSDNHQRGKKLDIPSAVVKLIVEVDAETKQQFILVRHGDADQSLRRLFLVQTVLPQRPVAMSVQCVSGGILIAPAEVVDHALALGQSKAIADQCGTGFGRITPGQQPGQIADGLAQDLVLVGGE